MDRSSRAGRDAEHPMKRRAAMRRLQRRAARGHPLWWVLAGVVVGVGGTAAALWRDADDEPRRLFGLRVPGYLGKVIAGSPASAPPPSAASGPRAD
jgi:hypothetical protein